MCEDGLSGEGAFWVQPMTVRLRGGRREWTWSSLDCRRETGEVVDST